MAKKVALISGITGQDGSYLTRYLLGMGYEIHGIKRRSSSFNTGRIDDLINDHKIYEKNLFLHFGDMTDSSSLSRIINEVRPNEIYNLAAQSHVSVSFETPEYTANVDALGVLRILETIRSNKHLRATRFYQASTSEIFGKSPAPQNEDSLFLPQSPYASAKLFAYWITKNYRDAYGLFASNGILFNHESPLRGETFVTRKIVRSFVSYLYGSQEPLKLGNLNAIRDWGHAREYVQAMWLMLNHKEPLDLVFSTGKSISVREFVEHVAICLGINLQWVGFGIEEKAIDQSNGRLLLEIDSKYFRPNEVPNLCGDSSRAKEILGWNPSVSIQELVTDMVSSEIENFEKVIRR